MNPLKHNLLVIMHLHDRVDRLLVIIPDGRPEGGTDIRKIKHGPPDIPLRKPEIIKRVVRWIQRSCSWVLPQTVSFVSRRRNWR